MEKLYAQIRGDEGWTLMPSDDAQEELDRQVARMKSHGFKVVTDEQGHKRVINPITTKCEVIYKVVKQS